MFGTIGKRRAAVVLFLLVFAAWAFVAVGLARSLLGQSEQPPPAEPKVPVVVIVRDVPVRTRLTAQDVQLASVPASARHPDAATRVEDVTGQVILRQTLAGEPVLRSTLASFDGGSGLSVRVPPGMRALAVSFSEVIGAGGLITPGDQVDVIAVLDDGVRGIYEAGYVLMDVRVLAVAQTLEGSDGTGAAPRDPGGGHGATVAKTVTLAVLPAEAERLALAERFGTLKLVVRAPGDTDRPPIGPVTADQVFLGDAAPAGAQPLSATPPSQPLVFSRVR